MVGYIWPSITRRRNPHIWWQQCSRAVIGNGTLLTTRSSTTRGARQQQAGEHYNVAYPRTELVCFVFVLVCVPCFIFYFLLVNYYSLFYYLDGHFPCPDGARKQSPGRVRVERNRNRKIVVRKRRIQLKSLDHGSDTSLERQPKDESPPTEREESISTIVTSSSATKASMASVLSYISQ